MLQVFYSLDARTSTQSKEDRLRNLGPTIVEASKFHSGTQKPNVWLQRIKLPEEFSAFYPSARLEGIEDDNAECKHNVSAKVIKHLLIWRFFFGKPVCFSNRYD